jgi:cysteine desulfurase family protein
MSLEAARTVENTRGLLARLLGSEDPARLAFTLNATDALNMAIKGVIRPGDHAVLSQMDHNSVLRPLSALAQRGIVSLDVAHATPAGLVTASSVRACLRPSTRLVTLTHASNVAGTINPVEEIGEMLQDKGILFLLDAAQTAGVLPIDVSRMPVDLVAFSGHKGLLGPQGTGALYARPGLDLEPWREGGTGSQSDKPFQPYGMPERLEAGTPNTPGLAGLGAGLEYLLEAGVARLREGEIELTGLLVEHLRGIPGLRVLGTGRAQDSVGVVSFVVDTVDPADLGYILDQRYSIMARPGLHCAPWAHEALGTFPQGTLRLSLGPFNTAEELKATRDAIAEVVKDARGF